LPYDNNNNNNNPICKARRMSKDFRGTSGQEQRTGTVVRTKPD